MHYVTYGDETGFENRTRGFVGGNGADSKAKSLIAQGFKIVQVIMGNQPAWVYNHGEVHYYSRR